jgi:hypothetical protein
MPARAKRLKTGQREERLVFAAVAFFAACAVLLPIGLAISSSQPDVYAFKPKPVRPDVLILDWLTLDQLLSRRVSEVAAPPNWFGHEVEVAGYMVPANPSEEPAEVTHFLLVPNPGDFLNPPHLHAGEVIDVRLRDGQATPLREGIAVTVTGKLSYGTINRNPRAVLFLTGAQVR